MDDVRARGSCLSSRLSRYFYLLCILRDWVLTQPGLSPAVQNVVATSFQGDSKYQAQHIPTKASLWFTRCILFNFLF